MQRYFTDYAHTQRDLSPNTIASYRDLAEAERRFAMGGLKDDDGVNRDRSNIGRDRVENAPNGQTRHP